DILDANGIFDVLHWPSPKIVGGEYCLLTCPCADKNYSEWLLGNLPRLSLIEQFPELKSVRLIVPRSLKPYQRESLEMAGIPSERLVAFDNGYWQVDKLYLTELPSPLGNPSPHAVAWLRSKLLKGTAAKASKTGRRLYVTRRDAPQRRVLNEPEIIDYLEGIGFETICPGDLSFAEQIQIFSDANIVVGPHGAAFANMVFAPPEAALIEFFGDNYLHGCYWALSGICGQKHSFVVGPSQWLDYSISLDELKATLEKVCGI
ncbi:MAG TPA: glycosyltransferase family 61 protein, partial [Verrucomicrobiae bacterium]|nr:glycosyltransferase family 61 protein [Verrucomicrobiae bacterium]